MKKVLITGGLGFIGTHLVEKLLKNNIHCIIIDNKLTNVVDEKYYENNNNVQFYNSNVIDVDYSQFKNIDCVFHLACVVGPYGVLKHAGKMGQNIINDTVKLVQFCSKNDVLLIDISTSQVYGQSGILSQKTTKIFPAKVSIRNQYALGKLTAESIIENTAKIKKNFRYHIIRPFNVTGKLQKPNQGFVLPRFVVGALTNQPITVFNDGLMKRSFTYVGDIIQAIYEIFNDQNTYNQIWNIGTLQNNSTILQLAQETKRIILQKYEISSKLKFINPKELYGKYFQQVPDKMPNANKFIEKYGNVFKTKRWDIINQVVDYYKNKIDKQNYYFDIYKSKKYEECFNYFNM